MKKNNGQRDGDDAPIPASVAVGASPQASRQRLVETLSVGGIIALIVFTESNFGLLSGLSHWITETVPFGSTLVATVICGLWTGLAVFSMRRRVEVTELKAEQQRITETLDAERITDALTGLPNMAGFVGYVEARLSELGPEDAFGLVGVEIGNLTLIRDVHGATVEAAVEREVADRLTGFVRSGDFVARGTGNTFYVALAGPAAAVHQRTELIVSAVVESFRLGLSIGEVAIPARIQVGTATTVPGAAADRRRAGAAQRLVERVDLAIHDSRRKGPGTVSAFEDDMKLALERRALIETSIAGALRAGEIVPYFQPLIDLTRDKVAGFEVLARWTHPTVGAISPAVFIPIADEIGVLGPLTLDLLEKACWAASGWEASIRLAVNVSPTVLRNPAFLDGFHTVLARTGFDARRLEVEITENAFIEEVTGLDSAITRLKANGISIAIDDFGTGYSSLHRLRSLPFDKIKIDQSFVRDMMDNTDSRRIVEAIIALGNSLGLPTVAEGIEAESNRSLLERLGCSTGQGYLFAPAMPAHEVPDFLARYTREGVAVLRRRTA